jgi:hypothetical protein
MEFISMILLLIFSISVFMVYMLFSILLLSDIFNSILFVIRKRPGYHDVIWFRSIVGDGIVIRGYGVVNVVNSDGFIIKYKNSDGSFGVVTISHERMYKLIKLQKVYFRLKIIRPHIYFKLN